MIEFLIVGVNNTYDFDKKYYTQLDITVSSS